tara:strand:- start:179 stop:487 length:309 start_codon:yes stop_codon:yes gene_type:complete
MKNYIVFFSLIFLIFITSIIKNTSKNLEEQIYNVRENLSILEKKYNYVFLENNYLSTPSRLVNIINKKNDNDYINLKTSEIVILQIKKDKIFFKDFLENIDE